MVLRDRFENLALATSFSTRNDWNLPPSASESSHFSNIWSRHMDGDFKSRKKSHTPFTTHLHHQCIRSRKTFHHTPKRTLFILFTLKTHGTYFFFFSPIFVLGNKLKKLDNWIFRWHYKCLMKLIFTPGRCKDVRKQV